MLVILCTLICQSNYNKNQLKLMQRQQQLFYTQVRPKVSIHYTNMQSADPGRLNFQFEITNHGISNADIWFTAFEITKDIASPFPSARIGETQYDTDTSRTPGKVFRVRDTTQLPDSVQAVLDSILEDRLKRTHTYLCHGCKAQIETGPMGILGVFEDQLFLHELKRHPHYLHVALIYSAFGDSSYLLNYTYRLSLSESNYVLCRFQNSFEELIQTPEDLLHRD